MWLVSEMRRLVEEEVVGAQWAHFQEPTVLVLSLAVECQEYKLSEIMIILLKTGLYSFLSPCFKGDQLLMEMLMIWGELNQTKASHVCRSWVVLPGTAPNFLIEKKGSVSTRNHWTHPGSLLKKSFSSEESKLMSFMKKNAQKSIRVVYKWKVTPEENSQDSLCVAVVICSFDHTAWAVRIS